MAIFELRIPPHFFDSANAENHFESVSERVAKAFLSDIVNVPNLLRGDDKLGEPDYISGDHGYEVTFAVNPTLIPQLKGVKELDGAQHNIEQSLISDITEAVSRKAGKTYSCKTNLVIIAISTLVTWYSSLYFKEKDPMAQMAWNVYAARRNKLFQDLYEQYILAQKFENIYIIQPTHDGTFALHNIKSFGEKHENYLTHVQASNPRAFPTYQLIDAGRINDVRSYQIRIVNYTI